MLKRQKECSYFMIRKRILKVDPCDVCGERVGRNPNWYTKCQKQVHRRCSDAPARVSLLSGQDLFVCRTSLGHYCSVKEKAEFKKGGDILEELEKFCYFGDMFSSYGEASEVVKARSGSPWKKFRELGGVLIGKQDLSLKQRVVLLYCSY